MNKTYKIALIVLLVLTLPQAFNYFPYPIVIVIMYGIIIYQLVKSIIKQQNKK